jgi:HSP20 family protein
MATLVRWDPFRELAQWQNDLGRLVGGLSRESGGNGDQRWVPPLDVWETGDEFVYAFDLPGIAEDKISVEFEDGTLTVSAERERSEEVAKGGFYRLERRHGSFVRSIGLPQGVTEDGIRADYANGVLELHVAKPKAPQPRRIKIGQKGTIEGAASDTGDSANGSAAAA